MSSKQILIFGLILLLLAVGAAGLAYGASKGSKHYAQGRCKTKEMNFQPLFKRVSGCMDCMACGDNPLSYNNELERRSRELAKTSFMER